MFITKEEAETLIPLLQAFIDGKTIQMWNGLYFQDGEDNHISQKEYIDIDTSMIFPLTTCNHSLFDFKEYFRIKDDSKKKIQKMDKNMKIINGCRRSGKTYKVLQNLQCNDLYVAGSMKECHIVYNNWISIHHPDKVDYNLSTYKPYIRPTFTTYKDFFSTSLRGFHFNNVYIENIELFLEETARRCGVFGYITLTSTAIIEELPVPKDLQKIIDKCKSEGKYYTKGVIDETGN